MIFIIILIVKKKNYSRILTNIIVLIWKFEKFKNFHNRTIWKRVYEKVLQSIRKNYSQKLICIKK